MKKIHYIDNYLLSPHHPVSVHIIGAGGTGSQVATNLARMDMALRALGHPGLHVTVFDPDTVSEANIGRQLFSESEIGLNKAVALVTRINRFFGSTWVAEDRRYPVRKTGKEGKGHTANIVITCTDNIRSRLDLWRFLKSCRKDTPPGPCNPVLLDGFRQRTVHRAGTYRNRTQQDSPACIKGVHRHTQNERHHRRSQLFHDPRHRFRTELLTYGSPAQTGPVHQLHARAGRLRNTLENDT